MPEREPWIEATLDPESARTAAGENPSLRRYLELLGLGFANPPKGGTGFEDAQEQEFVDAIEGSLKRSAGSIDALESVANKDLSPDLSPIAAVAASVFLAREGAAERAIEVLRRPRHRRLESRAFLDLHLGLRFAEIGEWAEALKLTDSIIDASAGSGKVLRFIRHVANRNAFQYAWAMNSPRQWKSQARNALLSRPVELRADGLSAYVSSVFDGVTALPASRTFRWAAQDPVLGPLECEWLSAELLGDRQSVLNVRQLLAKTRLVVGRPDDSLTLLRRAGDHKGVAGAAWLLWSRGPLQPLADELRTMARTERWYPPEYECVHSLLQVAASLLSTEDAARVADRLLDHIGGLPRRARAGSGDPHGAMRALAATLAVAPNRSHSAAAGCMWRLVTESDPSDAALLQPLAAAASSLDWEAVPPKELDKWVGFVSKNLHATNDRTFVARSVAVSLSRHSPKALESVLLSAFHETEDLPTGALLLDSGVRITPDVARRIVLLATASVQATAANARQGKYSGGAVDAALVLAGLANEYGASEAWQPLLDFVANPAVASSDKTRAVRYLVAHRDRVPSVVSDSLRDSARSLTAPQVPLMSQPIDSVLLRLNVAFAFGGISPEDAIAALVTLAGRDAEAKRAAADLMMVGASIPAEAAATLALELTQDSDPTVVASAAAVLPNVAKAAAVPIQQAVAQRLAELMWHDGAIVPRSVLSALERDRVRQWPTAVRDALMRLASEHVDQGVRDAARRAIGAA